MTQSSKVEGRQLLERRSFLTNTFKAIGIIGAGTLFEQRALATALAFEPADHSEGVGALFTNHQMQMLQKLTDIILPKTDTPGGVELGVHLFLDHQLFNCYEEIDQEKVRALLSALDGQSLVSFKKMFLDLSLVESEALIRRLEARESGFSKADKERFIFTKVLMAFGYFTSERGATEVLSYQAIPGDYVGSIPYSSVGSAWGSLEFY